MQQLLMCKWFSSCPHIFLSAAQFIKFSVSAVMLIALRLPIAFSAKFMEITYLSCLLLRMNILTKQDIMYVIYVLFVPIS